MFTKSSILASHGELIAVRPRSTRVLQHAHRQARVLKPLRLRRTAASPAPVVLAAAPSVPINFQIQYKTDFGQVLKVVGAGDIFGEWTPKDAPVLEWGEDDVWSATLNLPPGSYEFKFVVAAADSAIWEGGPNRTVAVPSPSTTGGGSYILGCSWGNPEYSLEAAGPEGVPTDSEDEAEILPEDAEGTVSGADDDDAGTVSSEVGKMTIGKMTVEGSRSSDSDADEGSVLQVGKMTIDNVKVRNDLIDTGIGAEEGFDAAEAMIPGEVTAVMASGDADDLESPFQKAFTGFLKGLGLKSGDDEDSSNGGSGSSDGPGSNSRGPGPAGATPLAALVAVGAAASLAASSGLLSSGPPATNFFRGPRC